MSYTQNWEYIRRNCGQCLGSLLIFLSASHVHPTSQGSQLLLVVFFAISEVVFYFCTYVFESTVVVYLLSAQVQNYFTSQL